MQKPDILFRQEPDTLQVKLDTFQCIIQVGILFWHAAGEIEVSRRVFGMVEPWVEGNSLEALNLKGFNHPVLAVEILRWREEAEQVEVAAAEAPRRRQQPS